MHVLVPDATSAPARHVAASLAARGHVVHHCSGAQDPTGCAALAGHRCPLDEQPVDVAVEVVPSGAGRPGEGGALCAARRRIPLVLAGDVAGHPLLPWAASAQQSLDVAATAEHVAADPLPQHTLVAERAARSELGQHVGVRAALRASVHRRNGALRVDVWVDPAMGRAPAERLATHVVQAVRQLDPWARGIDAVVHGPAPARRPTVAATR